MALASGESFFPRTPLEYRESRSQQKIPIHWLAGSGGLRTPQVSSPPPQRAAKRTLKLDTVYRMREFRSLCLVLSARWDGTQMDHSYRAFCHPHPKTRSASQCPHANTIGFNVQTFKIYPMRPKHCRPQFTPQGAPSYTIPLASRRVSHDLISTQSSHTF